MTIDTKGKEILRRARFDKFRRAFIDSLMERISVEGTSGLDLRSAIEQTLREEGFDDLVSELVENIAKETRMSTKDCYRALPVLVEEDVAGDVKRDLQGQVYEELDAGGKEKEIYQRGERVRLWKNVGFKRFLGQKSSTLADLFKFLREHDIVRYTLFAGISLLVLSSLLFGSVYKAMVVGLTLTVFGGESLLTKVANITGGFGGILVFFVFLTLVVQQMLTIKMRDEQVRMLAREYLRKRGVRRSP